MTRRSTTVAIAGAATGAVLALFGLALAAMFVAEAAPDAVILDASQKIARPQFVATAGAVYALVLIGFAIAGAVIAALTAGLAARVDPDEPRFGVVGVTLAGAAIGAVTAYATLRAGLGAGAVIYTDPVAGGTTITVSVFRSLVVALIVGIVTGSVTALGAELLSRPAALGLTGPAWPKSVARFVADSMPALVIPVLALVIGFAVVVLLSQLLLAGEDALRHFAVVVATGIAALVLGGAAFVASRPPRRNRDE